MAPKRCLLQFMSRNDIILLLLTRLLALHYATSKFDWYAERQVNVDMPKFHRETLDDAKSA